MTPMVRLSLLEGRDSRVNPEALLRLSVVQGIRGHIPWRSVTSGTDYIWSSCSPGNTGTRHTRAGGYDEKEVIETVYLMALNRRFIPHYSFCLTVCDTGSYRQGLQAPDAWEGAPGYGAVSGEVGHAFRD